MKRFIAKHGRRWVLAYDEEYTATPDPDKILLVQMVRDGESFYDFELRASKCRKGK